MQPPCSVSRPGPPPCLWSAPCALAVSCAMTSCYKSPGCLPYTSQKPHNRDHSGSMCMLRRFQLLLARNSCPQPHLLFAPGPRAPSSCCGAGCSPSSCCPARTCPWEFLVADPPGKATYACLQVFPRIGALTLSTLCDALQVFPRIRALTLSTLCDAPPAMSTSLLADSLTFTSLRHLTLKDFPVLPQLHAARWQLGPLQRLPQLACLQLRLRPLQPRCCTAVQVQAAQVGVQLADGVLTCLTFMLRPLRPARSCRS